MNNLLEYIFKKIVLFTSAPGSNMFSLWSNGYCMVNNENSNLVNIATSITPINFTHIENVTITLEFEDNILNDYEVTLEWSFGNFTWNTPSPTTDTNYTNAGITKTFNTSDDSSVSLGEGNYSDYLFIVGAGFEVLRGSNSHLKIILDMKMNIMNQQVILLCGVMINSPDYISKMIQLNLRVNLVQIHLHYGQM